MAAAPAVHQGKVNKVRTIAPYIWNKVPCFWKEILFSGRKFISSETKLLSSESKFNSLKTKFIFPVQSLFLCFYMLRNKGLRSSSTEELTFFSSWILLLRNYELGSYSPEDRYLFSNSLASLHADETWKIKMRSLSFQREFPHPWMSWLQKWADEVKC